LAQTSLRLWLTVLETHTSFAVTALGAAAAETPAPTVKSIVRTPTASKDRFTKIVNSEDCMFSPFEGRGVSPGSLAMDIA
jgi:hypothetical protein